MGKFKVLIVEDEGKIFDMIKDEMGEAEYEYVRARNVAEAIDLYEYSEIFFDCYIVDLQIGPLGLTEKEMVDFFRCEGYAWIKNYVFKSMTNEEKNNFKKKTIICSKYVPQFQDRYSSREREGFAIVHKSSDFEKEIKKIISRICNK